MVDEISSALANQVKMDSGPKIGLGLDATAQQPVDLKLAREMGTIDVEEFGTIIEGDVAALNRHRAYLKLISNNPRFDKSRLIYYSRQEIEPSTLL